MKKSMSLMTHFLHVEKYKVCYELIDELSIYSTYPGKVKWNNEITQKLSKVTSKLR